jgi:hypothetical protein
MPFFASVLYLTDTYCLLVLHRRALPEMSRGYGAAEYEMMQRKRGYEVMQVWYRFHHSCNCNFLSFSVADPGCLSGIQIFPSRIRIRIKEFKYIVPQKIVFKLSGI